MITTHSMNDRMAGKALGGFVEGYRPDRQIQMVMYSVPLAIFICSGFLTLHQPAPGAEQPGVKPLKMALSRLESVVPEPTSQKAEFVEPVEAIDVPVEVEPPVQAVPVEAMDLAEAQIAPVPVEQPVVPDVLPASDAEPELVEPAEPIQTAEPIKAAEPVEVADISPRPTVRPKREKTAAPEQVVKQEQVELVPLQPSEQLVAATEPVVRQKEESQSEREPVLHQLAELQTDAIASDADPTIPIIIEDPEFLTPPAPPDYPPMSVKRREQGTVVVRALVSGAGAAREVKIWQSSGFRRLDKAAQVAVQDWQFAPAFRMGLPVAAWVEVPVHFRLN